MKRMVFYTGRKWYTMKTLLMPLLAALLQFPIVLLYGRHLERNKPPKIHFYGSLYRTFKLTELRKAQNFAKRHPQLNFVIEQDCEVIVKGCAKFIHQIKLLNYERTNENSK